ncbi:NAD(P)H-binding protein [Saccharospirillum salsuginis]|uniref:NAD(P)-binding domain-containing protein n=1 Tax=Saccharospirillum salsuginis TaxID=418750 RepID=A0A918NCW0_9GAMM|nr:NAD(P)H-binding protein [Saccharospirillum salsuginis]GGX58372.1 hypothetical protein GCM10007392_27770 [Saccharospirillum salsuginis]
MTAVVLVGSTGMIGEAVARRLTQPDFDPVWLLVRRERGQPHSHHRIRVVDFDNLAAIEDLDLTGDSVICALGTTIRKAGSQAAFQQVDRDTVVRTAQWARALGASHFLFVSSLGADAASRNFYLRTKGEAEHALQSLGFEHLTIVRPSLLLGERSEFRIGERLGMVVGALLKPLLSGPLRRYRPVEADQVAAVLVHQAASPGGPAVNIWESERISRFRPDSR